MPSRKFGFGDVWVVNINYIRQQNDLGKRLIVVSNSKTFKGYGTFHKKADILSQKLAIISDMVINSEKRQKFFDV